MQQLKQEFTLDAHNAMLIDALYRLNGRAILAFVQRQVHSLEEAEDIVLEVFVAALESDILTTLSEQQQQAWLHRVARNKCIDHLRRTTRRSALSLDTITERIYADDEREPDKLAVRQEEHTLLRERLTLLTEAQQEVLLLKFGHGLRSSEIARHMHKSEGAVRMILARTLNFLRSIYTENEERSEQ